MTAKYPVLAQEDDDSPVVNTWKTMSDEKKNLLGREDYKAVLGKRGKMIVRQDTGATDITCNIIFAKLYERWRKSSKIYSKHAAELILDIFDADFLKSIGRYYDLDGLSDYLRNGKE